MRSLFITLGKKKIIPVSYFITFELVLLVSQCINLGALNQGGRDKSTMEVMTSGNVREGFKQTVYLTMSATVLEHVCAVTKFYIQ